MLVGTIGLVYVTLIGLTFYVIITICLLAADVQPVVCCLKLLYQQNLIMFEKYVLKLRRDFSCVIIPNSVYFAGNGAKKRLPAGTQDNFIHAAVAHAAACDCSDCSLSEAIENEADKVSLNNSENGYVIRSRSRQAIKNAANSIFFRCQHKEYLRFITFTFPPLPKAFDSKVDEDKFLHGLFKKFIDNERKHYGLVKWLWTNERQSGDRLESHEKSSREVLHYHCIFEYEDRINYYLVNLRFLRLLHRNNFDILSSHSKAVKKNSFQYTTLKSACQAIAKGDYDYFLQDSERLYFRDHLGIKRFMFLSPVDFERIKYNALNIGKISAYITKYISKASDKIYCRRWGCNKGLLISDEQLLNFAKENFPAEIIDYSTGEITMTFDKESLFKFLIMNDQDTNLIKFEVEIGTRKEEFIYIPPNWSKWRLHSGLSSIFFRHFNYAI